MIALGRLEKASVLVTVLLGLNTLYEGYVGRKRNRELDEKDRKIRDLEDRLKKLEKEKK
jgi:hypothetical protein